MRAELAASIHDTLLQEARRNESATALVRVLVLVGLVGIELWLLSGPSRLGALAWPAAGLTASYLVASLALWRWLRSGGFSRSLAFVLPVCDIAVASGRLAFVFALGAKHVASTQELATVVGVACLLAVTGAFRLQSRAVWWSTGLGVAFYAGFAGWLGLPMFHASVHVLLIAGCGAAGVQFTRILARAVQQEVTRMTLRRLLPASVVEAADSDPLALLTEPRSLEATVVVTDLRGFTTWAEQRPPLEVLSLLNEVQGMLAATVTAEGGMVDKFMGDGMLAVFGAPAASVDHADRALAAVARMLDGMARFPELQVGIGVHSGEIVVGCLGSGIRMEFTILGDTVNTASRIEAATKTLQIPVLVSDTTRARARTPLIELQEIELRGRIERLKVWTLPPPA